MTEASDGASDFIALLAPESYIMALVPGNRFSSSPTKENSSLPSAGWGKGRMNWNILCLGPSTILARTRGDKLYCVQEKSGGYKELVVYKMIWK